MNFRTEGSCQITTITTARAHLKDELQQKYMKGTIETSPAVGAQVVANGRSSSSGWTASSKIMST
jgi:hypothetical protein